MGRQQREVAVIKFIRPIMCIDMVPAMGVVDHQEVEGWYIVGSLGGFHAIGAFVVTPSDLCKEGRHGDLSHGL